MPLLEPRHYAQSQHGEHRKTRPLLYSPLCCERFGKSERPLAGDVTRARRAGGLASHKRWTRIDHRRLLPLPPPTISSHTSSDLSRYAIARSTPILELCVRWHIARSYYLRLFPNVYGIQSYSVPFDTTTTRKHWILTVSTQ